MELFLKIMNTMDSVEHRNNTGHICIIIWLNLSGKWAEQEILKKGGKGDQLKESDHAEK